MNKTLSSCSAVILLATIISTFSFAGCGGKGAVSESFYKYLDTSAAASLNAMKGDLSRYDEDLAKKSGYESKIKSLEPAIVDLSGFWSFDLEEFTNLQDSKITMQNITAMNAACREISSMKDALNWCTVCDTNKNDLKPAADKLDQIRSAWKTGYQSWTVTDYQKGIYLISGNGLGYDAAVASGQWYFTATDNTTKAAGPAAEAVAQLLEKRQGYDDSKKLAPRATYSCIPLPSGDRRSVDFWTIAQVKNDWREGSPQVSSVTKQYPLVSQFWTQLTEIGYKPSFKGGLYWAQPSGARKYNLYFQVYLP